MTANDRNQEILLTIFDTVIPHPTLLLTFLQTLLFANELYAQARRLCKESVTEALQHQVHAISTFHEKRPTRGIKIEGRGIAHMRHAGIKIEDIARQWTRRKLLRECSRGWRRSTAVPAKLRLGKMEAPVFDAL